MTWLISFAIGLVVTAIVLIVLDRLDLGVTVKGIGAALVAAILIAVVNLVFGNIMRLLALPLNMVTLGLVSGLINWVILALVIQVSDLFYDGLKVKNFWYAMLVAAVIAAVQWLGNHMLGVLN